MIAGVYSDPINKKKALSAAERAFIIVVMGGVRFFYYRGKAKDLNLFDAIKVNAVGNV